MTVTLTMATPSSAAFLYVFQPNGSGAIGYYSSTAVPDVGQTAGGPAQFCYGTSRCALSFNDAYSGVSDQVTLYAPGAPGAYDYYQSGAFTTPGFYRSQVGLFPTDLTLIKLPSYQAGSYLYLLNFQGGAMGYLSPKPIADKGANAGGSAIFCFNTSRCNISFNDAYSEVSDQTTLYAPGAPGAYDYFQSGAFTNPGSYPSLVGLFPAALTTIRLPDALAAAVPEPASWGLMIAGFGLIGAAMRRRKGTLSFA